MHDVLRLSNLTLSDMQAQVHDEEEQGLISVPFIDQTWFLKNYIKSASESLHNNGKGIKVAVSFTPLLLLPKPGGKHCKNAKAPIENL